LFLIYYLVSWEEIDSELSKKGIIFKKPTFRKYIQEKKNIIVSPKSQSHAEIKEGEEFATL